MNQALIKDVSDTSFWVAHYRATESARKDALFKDPYAHILVGDFADRIEKLRTETSQWTRWTVIMRTCIIDQLISDLISEGVTAFINIGAGLDTRPYRLEMGKSITWVEMDFSHVLEHKKKLLKALSPQCELNSVEMDILDRDLRRKYFETLSLKHAKIAVLTEGVLPYLTEQQVSELSEDLMRFQSIKYWIGEYLSPKSYPYLKNPKKMKILKNAPFLFFPQDWMGFFEARGWRLKESHYFSDISEKHNRPAPFPFFFKILELVFGKKWAAPFKRLSGFLLWEK